MLALMAVAGVIALFPSGPDYYLGIGDELGMLRAVLAVLLVGVAAGMVWVSWWLLVALMWPLRLLGRGSIQRYDVTANASISELTIGVQEIGRSRSATKDTYFHGPGASADIPVGAVAGGLPWVLDHPAFKL